jgi:Limiting CO2-inducible proteins B/C beta carbonyic anhydrases
LPLIKIEFLKKHEKLNIIRQHYPNAITTIDSVNKLIDFVEDVLDIEPSHIMLADSICSDDVNSIQYPARAHEFLGPFKMGGLDGFPFTGLTGMGAFANHVPDEGAVFIYYGPHIGISKKGVLGEIHRFGQHQNTGCCGAAKGALKKLLDDAITEGHITEIDYQMNTIEQILLRQKARITNAELPLKEATEVIYEAIDERINELVSKTTYNCKYAILVGAILINSDSDMGSFTTTKRFDVIDLETKSRKSYLTEYPL